KYYSIAQLLQKKLQPTIWVKLKRLWRNRASLVCKPSTKRCSISTKPVVLVTTKHCAMPTHQTIYACVSNLVAIVMRAMMTVLCKEQRSISTDFDENLG